MSRPIRLWLALAFGLALSLSVLATGDAAEPSPATMVVSLVVQQSCLVSAVDDSVAPAVSCLHGEPYLVSHADASPIRITSAVQFGAQRTANALWTVTF
ncbi:MULTISPECIES: hypothetical protein [unclassified Paraburkholderia]|uniref:hypothetical protein n=1 Tax=unclassified Paraburkholderia TaxID=2615204 RepID=UPI00198101FD|nr:MULTISPECIES: hypothetical protein [unclassified Paraburkholderia]MBN3858411.1 hypothetical protein [Paraburkholderia sp. Ac-20340]